MSEMRLQRALARAGVASRRAAEELIRAGRVRVDGKVATIGSKVDPERQKITVNGKAVRLQARRWLAFHKPMGVVTTADDEAGRRTVFDFIPDKAGLAYVGRLDVNTTPGTGSPGATPPWSTGGPRPRSNSWSGGPR
jgi:23S rRNA pseudouridine2605 synthase